MSNRNSRASNDEILAAREAWVSYGNALAKHFGLPADSQLAADGFEAFIQAGTSDAVEGITKYLVEQVRVLQS